MFSREIWESIQISIFLKIPTAAFVTHFQPIFHFGTPWKRQKGLEMKHWLSLYLANVPILYPWIWEHWPEMC